MPSAKRAKAGTSRLTVDDWVGAALGLLAEEGVGAVKIDRLCVQLGVTKGSFYWHFEDLASFLTAVADRWGQTRDSLRDEFVALREVEPRERIGNMLERLVAPDGFALERAVRDWARTDESVRVRVEQSDRWVFEEMRRAIIDLGFDKADAETRALGLFYAGVGFIHASPRAARRVDVQRERLIDILTT
jgi:AcrR family transcriptional regulator